MAFVLRPYQKAAEKCVLEARAKGARSVMVVMGTGLGKTLFAASVMNRLGIEPNGAKSGIFLAHRNRLLRQGWKTVAEFNKGVKIGGEVGARRGHANDDVVFASIASLRHDRMVGLVRRLAPRLSIVVIDEAHRAGGPRYRQLVEYIQDATPDAFILGITATAERTDGKSMADIFDDIVFEYGLLQGIEDAWSVPLIGIRIETSVVIDGVPISKKDFAEGKLARVLNVEQRNKIVIDAILAHGGNRRGLVFACGIEHAKALAEALRHAGRSALAVSGKDSPKAQQDALDAFARGTIQYVVSADLLLEGYDDPGISLIVWARPTKSKIVYTQGNGRGARPHGDIAAALGYVEDSVEARRHLIETSAKPNCLVIDVVDVSRNFSVQSLPTLLGKHTSNGLHEIEEESLQPLLLELPEETEISTESQLQKPPQTVTISGTASVEIDLSIAGARGKWEPYRWFPDSETAWSVVFPDVLVAINAAGAPCLGFSDKWMQYGYSDGSR
ncbi:MAG: DEAD/DEAH box helicase, partial [Vulcanimicrobiaceae bacterium]